MKNNRFIFFCSIVVIAAVLRFYQLGNIPPSPDWDEAALGYNAKSIYLTGKDEYGTVLPLSFRSYDDYKPPLYVYLTVPSVAIFGLNTWATRLPSAIMGVLAVIGTYFLVQKLFEYRLYKESLKRFDFIPFVSSFLLAISPWHIQFSRIAFEANIGVTINIWAVYFFLRGLTSKWYLIGSAGLFALGLYAYHSQRIFVPLLVLFLGVLYRKRIFQLKKSIILQAFIVGCVVLLPLIPVFFDKNVLMRLKGTSSFREQTEILSNNIKKLEYDRSRGYWIGELFDNRRIEYGLVIARGYLAHFSPKWLFVTGDHERHHAPDMGLLYIWELPFFLYGLFQLLKLKDKGHGSYVIFGWLLLAPIAASPTTQLPHAIRTLVFLPTFQICIAFGIVAAISNIKSNLSGIKRICVMSIVAIICFFAVCNVLYYLAQYFGRTNKEYSKFWQYGYKEAVLYTESVKDSYSKIVVSTALEQPYMFYLFFLNYDPVRYLENGGTKSGSFDEKGNMFDTYEFRPIDWNKERFDGKTLYVGSPSEMPHGNNAHITFLDGTPAIEIKDRKD